MKKIKEFFKPNIRKVVLILFILELMINIWIVPNQYDGVFFIEKMQEMSLGEFIGMRYETWTSRLILEIVTCVLLMSPSIFWILINTIMTTMIGYSIIKIFVKNDDPKFSWMTMAFVLIYPIYKVSSSGWGVGSIVYIWPLAMLLFSCIAIKKIFDGEKIPKFMYPLYSLALIFACNQEQSCVIVLGIYVVFAILYMMKEKKRPHTFLVVQLVLVILSLIFIATCPGNYARKNAEIEIYYMDFGSFGLFDKVSLGLTSTVNNLLTKSNVVFFVFSLVSAVYILKKYKNNFYRAVAVIPLVSVIVFGLFKGTICAMFPYLNSLYEIMCLEQPMISAANYLQPINFLPLIISFVVLGSMALNILLIFKNLKNNVAIVIFALGLMSRVAMGFSPTVFASTDRTFIFFEIAMLIICVLIWQKYLQETDKNQVKVRERLGGFIWIIASLQYLHTLIYTFMSQM